jgi:hypothetical protein
MFSLDSRPRLVSAADGARALGSGAPLGNRRRQHVSGKSSENLNQSCPKCVHLLNGHVICHVRRTKTLMFERRLSQHGTVIRGASVAIEQRDGSQLLRCLFGTVGRRGVPISANEEPRQ